MRDALPRQHLESFLLLVLLNEYSDSKTSCINAHVYFYILEEARLGQGVNFSSEFTSPSNQLHAGVAY